MSHLDWQFLNGKREGGWHTGLQSKVWTDTFATGWRRARAMPPLHFGSPTYPRRKQCSGLGVIIWMKLLYVGRIPSRESVGSWESIDYNPLFLSNSEHGRVWLTSRDQDQWHSWRFLGRLVYSQQGSGWPLAHRRHSNRFPATLEGPDEVKSLVLKQHISGLHVPAYITDEEIEAQRQRRMIWPPPSCPCPRKVAAEPCTFPDISRPLLPG